VRTSHVSLMKWRPTQYSDEDPLPPLPSSVARH
jgi:hypothetical protein